MSSLEIPHTNFSKVPGESKVWGSGPGHDSTWLVTLNKSFPFSGPQFPLLALTGGACGKEPTCQCRRCKRCGFDPWVGEIPWTGEPGRVGHHLSDLAHTHTHTHTHTHRVQCCCSVSKLCLTLFRPLDCSPPGASVHGGFQTRILQWVSISFSRALSQTRDGACISCTGRQIL